MGNFFAQSEFIRRVPYDSYEAWGHDVDRLPTLTHIIYDEERGLRDYDEPRLKSFAETQKMGRAVSTKQAGANWEKEIARGKGSDTAVILYTSGSTSRPKAVPLRHAGLIENGFGIGERQGLGPSDRVLVPVPLLLPFEIRLPPANAPEASLESFWLMPTAPTIEMIASAIVLGHQLPRRALVALSWLFLEFCKCCRK